MSADFELLGFIGDETRVVIQPGAQIGLRYHPDARPVEFAGKAVVRSNSVLYGDVFAGSGLQVGHGALIREHTRLGQGVMVGTGTVIDGHVEIGDWVKLQTGCYVPTQTVIGSRVFFGPHVCLTNDRLPLKKRDEYQAEGPVIEDGVTLGAGSVVLPGVVVGAHSFVAAGAVVTRDVPPHSLVIGVPGRIEPLPEDLRGVNHAPGWPAPESESDG